MQELFDPARHEALNVQTWSPELAHRAIERSWLLHPEDEPAQPGARSLNHYWGATGVV